MSELDEGPPPFLRVTKHQGGLITLNFSEKKLELDFSHTKDLKRKKLNILFSSAKGSAMVKSQRGLEIAPFEAFIAEVQSFNASENQ